MRLTKSIYHVSINDSDNIIDYDKFGNPIYGDPVLTRILIPAEVEPFSSDLAKMSFGVFLDCRYRCFTRPNPELIKIHEEIHYGNDVYKIVSIMPYDRHTEFLIEWIGEIPNE